jgi:uncharacterized protein (TIGR03118 family)
MKQRWLRSGRTAKSLAAVSALALAGSLTWMSLGAQAAPARGSSGAGTVLQTNLVSDLPGVADDTDANLVNPWGISESGGSPFWLSDNNAGVSTLYSSATPPIATVPLVVNIPTPVSATGGTPSGTVFNTDGGANGGFKVTGVNSAGATVSASPAFLFDTEDGTILGWAPSINGTNAIIAQDNSGNNFTVSDPDLGSGAVYKGLAIATSTTPIIASDPNSTALLYAANFRSGAIDVYDGTWTKVSAPGAFTDRGLPRGYAPFNVQVLGGKLYVTYALQDANKHDDVGGPHHGFVDVYNLDGTPGLPWGVRLISGGSLDSPWGLAIAPAGFAGFTAPGTDQVLLVGNFKSGHVDAYDASSGVQLGRLRDPDGEPISINRLWALSVGNGGSGGATNTVYFSAGIFDESHGLFGSFTTAAPGSAEGPAQAQWVTANTDVVQQDIQQLSADQASGASADTIRADAQTLNADTAALAQAEQELAADAVHDAG